MSRLKKNLLSVLIIVVSVVGDQLTKWWATSVLKPIGDIPLWNGVFHLSYATNTGASFSILEGKRWLFIVLTVVALAAGLYFLFGNRVKNALCTVGIALLVGGATGNFIDRVTTGKVVDMFYIKLINFPVFNVADLVLTAGTICVVWYLLFFYQETEKKNG